MNALQIIDEVRNRYCMCSSYMDEGFVEMRRSDRLEGLVEFKTFYRQPNQFRFEFKKKRADWKVDELFCLQEQTRMLQPFSTDG